MRPPSRFLPPTSYGLSTALRTKEARISDYLRRGWVGEVGGADMLTFLNGGRFCQRGTASVVSYGVIWMSIGR